MNKLLTAGLVAAVAMTSANASQCGNGGFYVQGNLGISLTEMKYKNDLDDQKGVVNLRELDKMVQFTVRKVDTTPIEGYTGLYNYEDLEKSKAQLDITKKSLKKRRNMVLFELGLGYDFRINDVMIGLDLNLGKNFGNVKKKETQLALTNYLKASDLSHPKVNTIPDANDVINIANPNVDATTYNNNPAGIAVDALEYVKLTDSDIALFYDPNSEYEIKMKNKYFISLMPRVGYLIAPECELYLTAGVKVRSDKYRAIITTHDSKFEGKKSVTKCIPSVGAGLRYEFGSGMFANFSVVHNFKAKKTIKGMKAFNDTTTKHTLQSSSTDVKLGFGKRF